MSALTKKPNASVIILNYNGENVIATTLKSVYASAYPRAEYEVIVVDNNSTDGSVQVLKKLQKTYPQLRLVLSDTNDGFAGGNTKGYEVAKGDYCILLNNDVIVDKNWIHELVKTADADPQIFSVNSKIQLFPHFFMLTLHSNIGYANVETSLDEGNLLAYTRRGIRIMHTFVDGRYQLHVPLHPIGEASTIKLTCHIIAPPVEKPEEYMSVAPHPSIVHTTYTKETNGFMLNITLDTTRIKQEERLTKIQNAGIVVYDNGSGRDIGAVVRYYGQDYEIDAGQYDTPKEVYASCGAAVLFRMSHLEKIGFLSRDFFMYYEDVDMCERARMYGYITVYQPKACVRHMHALSSEEWSPFFIYHAEKGRLVHIAHHFPMRIFLSEWFDFTYVACGRLMSHIFQRRHWIKDIQYLKVAGSLIMSLPKYLQYRKIHTTRKQREGVYADLRHGKWLIKSL